MDPAFVYLKSELQQVKDIEIVHGKLIATGKQPPRRRSRRRKARKNKEIMDGIQEANEKANPAENSKQISNSVHGSNDHATLGNEHLFNNEHNNVDFHVQSLEREPSLINMILDDGRQTWSACLVHGTDTKGWTSARIWISFVHTDFRQIIN